jgi:hypothetical protein
MTIEARGAATYGRLLRVRNPPPGTRASTADAGSSTTASRTSRAGSSAARTARERSTSRPDCTREECEIHAGTKACPRVGSKEQRQYEHIKEAARREGRYGKRAAELARTVLKQHKAKGIRKGGDDRIVPGDAGMR